MHAGARGQFLTGRWLLRGVVGPLSGVAPEALVVRESERGALELDGVYVNLSHTDGLVALAVSATPVGVDVEDRQRPGRTVELADRFFAPSESRALRALPPERQRDRFFDLWTLKEAYIKARALGLAIPLASFAFDLDAPTLGFTTTTEPDASRWEFARLDPTPRHRLAVARARAGMSG
ncbi:MAG: 4'-phosphopantetheinyl transferase superfamily protein [Deltaproteobacteria bacterium]|nr:4'-phosphopantetheinyl transferase superfamily protein [Deltaproteobacteria bacterium]